MSTFTPEIKALLKEFSESNQNIEDPIDSTELIQTNATGVEDKDCNGDNWTPANIVTLMIWISMSYYQLKILEVAIKYNRDIVRNNVILGFILSTASGTISAATFGGQSSDLNLKLSILFTVMSFVVSIYAAFIKIFQIQENLEKFIKSKQEWINFSTYVIAELHLPITHRYDAMKIIKKNKDKYLQLLKGDLEINWRIRQITRNQIARKEKKRDANKWIFQKGYDLPTILMNSLHKLNLEYNYLMVHKKSGITVDPSCNICVDKQLLDSSLEDINEELNKQLNQTYKLQLDMTEYKKVHAARGHEHEHSHTHNHGNGHGHKPILSSSSKKISIPNKKLEVHDKGTDPIPYSLPQKSPIQHKDSINKDDDNEPRPAVDERHIRFLVDEVQKKRNETEKKGNENENEIINKGKKEENDEETGDLTKLNLKSTSDASSNSHL